jgi:hypothetical protein
LLTHTGYHLAQIDVAAFGATDSHDQRGVVSWQLFLQNVTSLFTDLTQLAVEI